MSATARSVLGLDPLVPINAWEYAKHVGVLVLNFDDLDLSKAHRDQLLQTDGDSWSGMTLKEGSVTAVILNPSHSPARRCSTLMHELAHILLKHVPTRVEVSPTGMLLLSDYSDEQESEADWLAAAILLPRDAIVAHRSNEATAAQIAELFCISQQLCEWRIRMTGVDVQLRRARRLPR